MKKTGWLLAVAAITVLFFQCQKEVNFTGEPDTGGSVNPAPISTSLQGNITDENDQPAAGVTVTAGTSTTITDAKGYFRFTNASLDKNTTLVTASKDGYFKGYRVFAATSGCNQVAIKLIKKNLAGSVPSSAGGEVSLSNGAKVSLPAGGVVTASAGSAYSGDIKVYASYIDPNSSDINKIIPGSLVGNSKDGKRVTLASYGMLAVELSSASGEKLQIKSGSSATLTIPIPAASLATAPATISLWFVDETTGIWQEEGTATKQGNNYTGVVKHFSYWNCDYSYPSVNISFTLQTAAGAPVVNAHVQMRPAGADSSIGGLAHGNTDSLGQVNGAAPAGIALILEVYDDCGNRFYSQNISPLTSNTDLGVIQISANTSSVVTLKGKLLDCNNNPVTNGYAFINVGNATYYASTDANGNFSTTYVSCVGSATKATVVCIDQNALQQSGTVTINITAPVTDVGNITACGTSAGQFIKFTIDGVDYSITDTMANSVFKAAIISDSSTYIFGQIPQPGISLGGTFEFFSNVRTPGTYPILGGHIDSCVIGDIYQPTTVTFTEVAAQIGDFYAGSLVEKFKDDLYPDSTVIRNVTGTFRVRRTQ